MATDHLKQWLLSRTGRGGLLKVSSIEAQMEVKEGTLKHWLAGRQPLAEHHVEPLIKLLKTLEYKPE